MEQNDRSFSLDSLTRLAAPNADDELTVPMVPWHRHVWTFLALSFPC